MQGKSTYIFFRVPINNQFICSRKRALGHIARASERYLSDDPKTIAEIEEIELEYLFK